MTSSIYSVDTLLYPYALPFIQSPYPFSSLCLSCNLSSSLRSLQGVLENYINDFVIPVKWSKFNSNAKEIPILEVVVGWGEVCMENDKVKAVME